MQTQDLARARVTMLLLVVLASAPAAQDALDGSWELTAYESRASVGKASGLLTFASGWFSLVYTMDEPGGRTSGRAHAGRFQRVADTITLDVDWTMEYVNGKGQAQRGGKQRRTVRVATSGDRLTLTYENGSIQQFQRAAAAVR
jgi:hypothetical protein